MKSDFFSDIDDHCMASSPIEVVTGVDGMRKRFADLKADAS